jgi:hypothetical protein
MRIVRATVRVVFHRQATKRLLQLDLGNGAFDAEDLVVITLAHTMESRPAACEAGSFAACEE